MEALLSTPLELQISIAAGYLGWWIATIGNRQNSPADMALQILLYSIVARSASSMALAFAPEMTEGITFAAVAVSTIGSAVIIAIAWRSIIRPLWGDLMAWLGVYYDDHQTSSWRSINEIKDKRHTIHIHLKDGSVLECNYAETGAASRAHDLYVAEDGMALPVTKFYRADGTSVAFTAHDNDFSLDYIPRSEIQRVTWHFGKE
ncbi:hypothetical protein [Nitratireductor sp. PBL-C9]|uniref:hypothetical protein n=1 Tax=Nitratireductor sp. PBL-C9 TaxID=3435013 RepID=UPI003D7D9FA8